MSDKMNSLIRNWSQHMALSTWFFGSEKNAEKTAAATENKESNALESKEETLSFQNFSELNGVDRFRKCLSVFADDTQFILECKHFLDYVATNGETEPLLSGISSLFGGKTKQTFNARAKTIFEEFNTNKKLTPTLIELHLFNAICKLKEIHNELLKDTGDTKKHLENILRHYKLPLEKDAFTAVASLIHEVLKETNIKAIKLISTIPAEVSMIKARVS
jgi:hypothetical protein